MKLPTALLALLLAAPVCGVDADDRVDLTTPIERNLPPEQNAYTIWKEVLPKFEPPEDEEIAKALHDVTRYTKPMPSGDVRAKLEAWLDSMESNLDRLYEGLARGACQLPKSELKDPYIGPSGFLRATNAQLLLARFHAEYGLYAEAADTLIKGLRYADLGCSADGAMIHWLAGFASRDLFLRAMRWVAMRDAASSMIPDLLAGLPQSFDQSAVHRSLQIEFMDYTIPALDDVISGMATNTLFKGEEGARLLNRDATTTLLKDLMQTVVENTLLSWAMQKPVMPEEVRTLLETQEGRDMKGLIADAPFYGQEWFMNEDNVRRVKRWGKSNGNGVGLLLVGIFAPACESVNINYFSGRTETSLTRAYLLLRAHQLREKEWPTQLSDALPANPPPDAVLDYFSNQPLRYSRERGLLWSVGPDGIDNDGDPAKDIVLDLANPVKISKPQP